MDNPYQNIDSLFLSTSYQDSLEDYKRVLLDPAYPYFDYVFLTSSNAEQAKSFERQLEIRRQLHYLPLHASFVVLPDRNDERVGSGGATLEVLDYLRHHEGRKDFSHLRILVIHSGGDSKRIPQYSAIGKLFSPIPRLLPNGRPSTLFDEFLISTSTVPSRFFEGMLLLSGDVLLLFNALQIDFSGRGAAAISFKEKAEVGKDHGVFLPDEKGYVASFLHKQTVKTLQEKGAVNAHGNVDIDTGAVLFGPDLLKALYSLIDTEEKFKRMVSSKTRLSLYADFLYPLATSSTLEQFYLEKPEGELNEELHEARTLVWNALSSFKMKLLRLSPAKFLHFGTSKEVLALMQSGYKAYESLGWGKMTLSIARKEGSAGYVSVCSTSHFGKGDYLEYSYVHPKAKLGKDDVVSFLDLHDETLPDRVVAHGLKQRDGTLVARIFGVDDNPKESRLYGIDLEKRLVELGIPLDQVWGEGEPHDLWNARLYPACPNIKEALRLSLGFYEWFVNGVSCPEWKQARKESLKSGFANADPAYLERWASKMMSLVQMNKLKSAALDGVDAAKVEGVLKEDCLNPVQTKWLEKEMGQADPALSLRLPYYVGTGLGGGDGNELKNQSFYLLSQQIISASLSGIPYRKDARIVQDELEVRLPLRVNFGGGWSDTPPYCNENGGTVLNAAISLDGQLPVWVKLTKLEEHKIVFFSHDMDVRGEFTDLASLQSTGDPYDPFALQKACLLVSGVIPFEGGDFEEIMNRLGGGFSMQSEVTGVPKGSGLGTSSILGAAALKAVTLFTGEKRSDSELCEGVLAMEQIMSTGGGWQDQVGGIRPGVKFITSAPGLKQKLQVENLNLTKETQEELQERFALIYTGQRRLARNLLRDVVFRYLGSEPGAKEALDEVQKTAALMKFELERGNIDGFASLLDHHWELSKKIDEGSTNTLIELIFRSIDDLIDGRMVCGAGGGGFLQVILKKGVTKEEVSERLKEVFQDAPVDVWPSAFLW